jgi:hypothetical protein
VSFHLSALPDLFDFVDSVALLAVYSLHQQEVFQELKSVLLAAAESMQVLPVLLS